MHGLRRQRLEELLRSLFDVQGLYRFLDALGRDVRDSLRPGLSLLELVDDATSLIERRGCWGELFVSLTRERPLAHPRIVAVASLFEVRLERPTWPVVLPTDCDGIRGLMGPTDGVPAIVA